MATYLQGVSHAIPQIQPFQPDLNFYANVLQTKQNQYDQNWKALNNMYGQFYYADLTRDSNIEKKEHLIKNIDYNLKRVAGLDLSLQQNVTQAAQVFKPFYEDKVLMKDMAWTKNYMNARGRANGLKNAEDEEMRSQYWDAGVRALDYRREEFKETTDEQSMAFGNVSYTPYVNVSKEAMKIAKEAGLSVESVDFSPDGKWIIKKKNGQPLMEPLQKLFESTLGKDPRVMGVYQTQAYVNRKDYAYGNAAQFGGDKNAAELDYLQKNFTMLRDMNTARRKQLMDRSKVLDARTQDVQESINKGTAQPGSGTYLDALNEAQGVNETVLQDSEKMSETLSGGSSTLSTSTGFQNPYGDIESLRRKVDAGMASMLMQKDLGEAAYIYAHRDMKMDIEANPYKVLQIKQANRMAAIRAKADADKNNMVLKEGLKTGVFKINPLTGGIEVNREIEEPYMVATDDASTPEVDMYEMGERVNKMQFGEYAQGFTDELFRMLSMGIKEGKVDQTDLEEIFDRKLTTKQYNDFIETYKEDGFNAMADQAAQYMADGKDGNLYSMMVDNTAAWLEKNKSLQFVQDHVGKLKPHMNTAKIYGENLNNWNEYKQAIKEGVMKDMEGAGIFFDKDGTFLSSEEAKERAYKLMSKNSPKVAHFFKNYKGAGGNPYLKAFGMTNSTVAGATWLMDQMDPLKTVVDVFNEEVFVTKRNEVIKAMSSGKYAEGKLPPFINGEGGALSSQRVGINVAPKAYGSRGVATFNEIGRAFRGLDLDKVNNKISFDGASKFAFDNAAETTDMGSMIMNQLITDMSNPNNKLNNFAIEVQGIAGADANTAAVILRPDRSYLEQFRRKGKDSESGLTDDHINAIATNGLTIMGDADNALFQTSLFDSYMDPIAAQLKYNDTYTWEDAEGLGKFHIEADPLSNNYVLTSTSNVWDAEKGEFIQYSTRDVVLDSQNLLSRQNQFAAFLDTEIKPHNAQQYNGSR